MFDRLHLLKEKGYRPDAILDVGAFRGDWSQDMNMIYPFTSSDYHLFEANDRPDLKNIKGPKSTTICLLSDKVEEVDFYKNNSTGDSMMKEKTKHYTQCQIEKRTTSTLDIEVQKIGLDKYKSIFLKIDVQGAEIKVLKGFQTYTSTIDFILLELPFFGQYNEGCPTFLETIAFMDKIGYVVYELIEEHRINGFLVQIDILFIKSSHPLTKKVQNMLLH